MNTTKKYALITGSTGSIGKDLLKTYINLGYVVIALGHSNKNSLDYFKTLYGSQCIPLSCNIQNYSDVENTFRIISKFTSYINVVINNAGITNNQLFNLTSPQTYYNIISTNLLGTMNICHCSIPILLQNNGGHIINISSVLSKGASCESAYSASKAGIESFTKSIAKEVGRSNIYINSIRCGFIESSMNNNLTTHEKELFLEETSLGFSGQPKDVSSLATFLTEHSNYITGSVIDINGGI